MHRGCWLVRRETSSQSQPLSHNSWPIYRKKPLARSERPIPWRKGTLMQMAAFAVYFTQLIVVLSSICYGYNETVSISSSNPMISTSWSPGSSWRLLLERPAENHNCQNEWTKIYSWTKAWNFRWILTNSDEFQFIWQSEPYVHHYLIIVKEGNPWCYLGLPLN